MSQKNNFSVNDSDCECIVCTIVKNGFSSFNFEQKKKIILKGRPTPNLKRLTKQTKLCLRHFQVETYEKSKWLTGCDTKARLFCWPCLLFSNDKNLWNKNGFSDLNNLHKLLKRHSVSLAHLRSLIQEKNFGRYRLEHAVDNQLRINHEQHNQQVRRNRKILRRLIDTVCFLNEHELGFQGHNESANSANNGHYVNLLNFLAKYDETLSIHLENSTVFKGTSNLIQNDLISCIGEMTLRKIKQEIDEASFISIILDEISDVANVSQLSKVVRYVARSGEIKERFLGFVNSPMEKTALALYNIVQILVDDLKSGPKLVAQSYNGAAVMAGELGGLQAKVRKTYPSALFINCMAHNLNLVLQQSLSCIKECEVFFSTLDGLAEFFLKSSKRIDAWDAEIHKRLPRVPANRWNCDGRSVQTMFEYRQLINFFEKVLEDQTEWDHETVICSRGYLDTLKNDPDFNFLLIVFSEIFPFCDNLFATLQSKSTDINLCISKIQEFKSTVIFKRKQFTFVWTKFQQLGLELQSQNTNMEDEEAYYRRLFLEVIDNITVNVDTRFAAFNNLKFVELVNFCDNAIVPEDSFKSLKQSYFNFFDFVALKSELTVVYSTSEGINKNSVGDLWKSIYECGLEEGFPEIIKLCELTLTIPVITSASTERGLSTLKRIKKFVRNSTGPERLSNLAVLCIEKELVQELSEEDKFYDDVIDEFAKKCRKIPLQFKFPIDSERKQLSEDACPTFENQPSYTSTKLPPKRKCPAVQREEIEKRRKIDQENKEEHNQINNFDELVKNISKKIKHLNNYFTLKISQGKVVICKINGKDLFIIPRDLRMIFFHKNLERCSKDLEDIVGKTKMCSSWSILLNVLDFFKKYSIPNITEDGLESASNILIKIENKEKTDEIVTEPIETIMLPVSKTENKEETDEIATEPIETIMLPVSKTENKEKTDEIATEPIETIMLPVSKTENKEKTDEIVTEPIETIMLPVSKAETEEKTVEIVTELTETEMLAVSRIKKEEKIDKTVAESTETNMLPVSKKENTEETDEIVTGLTELTKTKTLGVLPVSKTGHS